MKNVKIAFILSISLFILCGLIYPLAMTGISQVVFSKQANGSIVELNGKKVGSYLLGQDFKDARFFHGRISSVNYNTHSKNDKDYAGVSSGSQNLGPSNKALTDRVKADMDEFLKNHKELDKKDIPTDLLTSSGSGLDPHISIQSAMIQIPLISENTGISISDLEEMIDKNKENRQLGLFGEPRVNVLKLNIEIADILKINQ